MTKGSIFKRYRIYVIFNGHLCWFGSYERAGNMERYAKETGSTAITVVALYSGHDFMKWMVSEKGLLRDATDFETRVLNSLNHHYT